MNTDFKKRFIEQLKELPELVEVYVVCGSYDIIVKVTVDTINKLKETISLGIRKANKITSTLTLIVIEGQH